MRSCRTNNKEKSKLLCHIPVLLFWEEMVVTRWWFEMINDRRLHSSLLGMMLAHRPRRPRHNATEVRAAER